MCFTGTIFQKTKIPLQKWFLAIAILLNAKKSVSSYQLARDLDMNQKSAWFLAMRVRTALVNDTTGLLSGIIEADECFVGGKPRKGNRRPYATQKDQDPPRNKRGRGTSKLLSLALSNAVAVWLPALLRRARSRPLA